MVPRIAILAATLAVPAAAPAASPAAPEGRRLVESHRCEACHQEKFPGPPGTIYLRKDRKVTSWARLQSQVAACNANLNLGLFPEDERAIALHLNAAWYRFPVK